MIKADHCESWSMSTNLGIHCFGFTSESCEFDGTWQIMAKTSSHWIGRGLLATEDLKSEVIQMPTQAVSKPATSRQLAYIKRLHSELGMERPDTNADMSASEASSLISELIPKARTNGALSGLIRNHKVNEARLGMAMKECFRLYTRIGGDIWEERRAQYIRRVNETYELFTEIGEMVARGEKIPPESPL
jgi:hypothetical protein